MKKNQLRLMIRQIVREEVQMALKEELTEVFKALKTKPITETKRRVVKKRKPIKELQLAKDPVFNKLLNETRGGVPQGEEEYPTMGDKTFDSTSMASLMGYGNVDGQPKVAETTVGHTGARVQDETLMNNLNRDYSGVMKAIEKKKGGVK